MRRAARSELQHVYPSLFAGSDLFQLTGHEHEPGTVRPLYEDEVWDWRGLSLAPKTMTDREKVWDFRRISNPLWRAMTKDLLLALMVPKHPDIALIPTAHRRDYDPRTIFQRFCGLVRWFNWLSSIGLNSLQSVDQDVCDRYLREVRKGQGGLRRRKRRLASGSLAPWVEAVRLPYCYGDLFPGRAYEQGFSPWQGRRTAAIVGKRYVRTNSTPPVPDDVLKPLIGNCAYLVETIAPLVLDLHRERLARFPAKRSARSIAASASAQEDFDAVLARYVAAQKPLPQLSQSLVNRRLASDWGPSDPLLLVNIDSLFHEANVAAFKRADLPHVRRSIENVVAVVGVEYAWARDAIVVQKASDDGSVTWTLPLSETDLHRLNHYICGACMVLTAAVTGMRPSEIAELSPTSPKSVVHLPGGGKRFVLGSKIIKRRRFGGDLDEWVVLESVHKAVETAAELAALGRDHIFGAANIGSFVDNFRSWLTQPFAVRLGLAPIPPGPVNGRMLRRALSIELGNRPWGLFAAKYHLKHASVLTTEGYVARPGGAQAQFHREVLVSESEHSLHLARQAVEDYREGRLPAGPGARQLIGQLKLADEALRLEELASPKVLKSDRAAENIMRELATALHVNVANYCFFRDPAQALCLRLAGLTDAKAPLTAMCDSARCGQASYGPQHLQIWTEYTANTAALASSAATAPGERTRLRLEVKRGKEVIRQIQDSTRDPQK